jgi:glucosamine--fructose-6-phosphate aminotransferase (isomerizing)
VPVPDQHENDDELGDDREDDRGRDHPTDACGILALTSHGPRGQEPGEPGRDDETRRRNDAGEQRCNDAGDHGRAEDTGERACTPTSGTSFIRPSGLYPSAPTASAYGVSPASTELERAMRGQPADLTRLLADGGPFEELARRVDGRRISVVGTGTSFHAANQGAYLLRLAGADAIAVSAADSALWGQAPAAGDALVLLSHRGTKRYTSQVLARARENDVRVVTIGGVGSGAELETVAQERSGTFTTSHLGALLRLAQLARALGAELELEAVPDAVAAALSAPSPGVEVPERGLDFVGAGPNQWTAAEGALKVREASHLFTSAYAVEQLLHGPGFALEALDGLVCLDGGGAGAERLAELSAAIESRGTRVHRFAATELGEPLSIFALTVVVQRIALDFATRLGTDPDNVAPPVWKSMQL